MSMETVEKRVQLDVDACKVITPIMYEPFNVLMLAWKSRDDKQEIVSDQ